MSAELPPEHLQEDTLSEGAEPAADRSQERPASVAGRSLFRFRRPDLGETILAVALLMVLAFGIVLRFSWTNWHQGTNLHPDEYGLTGTLTQLSIPNSLGDYFNTAVSPISPYQKYDLNGVPTAPGADNRMRWGQWPIILIRASAELLDQTGYDEIRMLGRRLSALTDVLTLLLVYAIGTRLYSWKVGLLASALSAVVVMQIQQSHFMTVDNFSVFFTTLAMYAAVRIAECAPEPEPGDGLPSSAGAVWNYLRAYGWLWYVLFGVALGMALASRVNLLPLAGMVLVAAYLARSRTGQPISQQTLAGLAIGLVLAGAFTLLTFRVVQPMSFRAAQGTTTFFTLTPNPDWVDSMKVASSESRGIGGGPPGEQWTNRLPIQFPLTNMVLWGMGLPLGVLVWAGFFVAAVQLVKRQPSWRAHLLLVVWVGGFFLFMGTRWVTSMRYFLTIYPFLILLGAWLLVEIWNWGARLAPRQVERHNRSANFRGSLNRIQVLSLSLGIMVVGGTALWAWGFVSAVYRQDHTRIKASEWIYQNAPAAASIQILTDGGVHSEPLPAGFEVQIEPDQPLVLQFTSPVEGELAGVTFGHARSNSGSQVDVRVMVALNQDGGNPLGGTRIPVKAAAADPRGETSSGEFLRDKIEKDRTYYVLLEPQGGSVTLTGSVLANESWD